MRNWKSGIVTVTVRDQRYRQHDPILGVVPLKLSEILSSSSQVTRWYPLDGGIVSQNIQSITRSPLMSLGIWSYKDLFAFQKHRNPSSTKDAWMGCRNLYIQLRPDFSAWLPFPREAEAEDWW